MKKLFTISLIIPILLSCKRNETGNRQEFYIKGQVNLIVENGLPPDTIELALIFDGDSTHTIYSTTIQDNGTFIFNGELSSPNYALVVMREDVVNDRMAYSQLEFIVNPDTMNLTMNVLYNGNEDSRFSKFRFESFEFDKNNVNTLTYDELWPAYRSAMKGGDIQSTNPAVKDSLEEFVYPSVRKKVMTFVDSIYDTEVSDFALNDLVEMIDFGATETQLLNNVQVSKLLEILESLDPNVKQTSKFKLNYQRLAGNSSPQDFYDGNLQNILGKNFRLSEICKINKYTVLYFWHSGCAPCRKFNKNFSPDLHKQLKMRNIEFVSVNTDLTKELWTKTSKKDSIYWTNLFVGRNSQLSIDYDIQAYPNKIIFNKDYERVDFKYKNAIELLDL